MKTKPNNSDWQERFDKLWSQFVSTGGKRPVKDFITYALSLLLSMFLFIIYAYEDF